MKMQNAEMEFITFDAPDVIATSGGLKTAWFQVAESLIPGLEFDGDGRWSIENDSEHGKIDLFVNSSFASGNATYVLTSGTSYYTKVDDSEDEGDGMFFVDIAYNIFGATEGSSGDEQLTSLDAIIRWLDINGKKHFN